MDSGSKPACDIAIHRVNNSSVLISRLAGLQIDRNRFTTQSITFGYAMPVLLDDHDPEIDLRPGTTKSGIVAHLYQNPEWGYSPQDLKETLDIPRGTATTTLKRLNDDGYVGKTDDGYYYALDERKDIRQYVSSLDQVHRMFGHHREMDATPEEPEKQIGAGRTDEEVEAELAELESELGDVDE